MPTWDRRWRRSALPSEQSLERARSCHWYCIKTRKSRIAISPFACVSTNTRLISWIELKRSPTHSWRCSTAFLVTFSLPLIFTAPEVEMPFEWKRLVNVARQLEEQAGKDELNAEALQRSAVGRAYYAAFGHARSYAQSFLGYKVKGDADDHGALRAHLKRSRRGGDAQRLDSLRWWRNDADY